MSHEAAVDALAAVTRVAHEYTRVTAEYERVEAELEKAVAVAQAHGAGVRKLGQLLGVSKSKASVMAERGRAKLDVIPSQDHAHVV